MAATSDNVSRLLQPRARRRLARDAAFQSQTLGAPRCLPRRGGRYPPPPNHFAPREKGPVSSGEVASLVLAVPGGARRGRRSLRTELHYGDQGFAPGLPVHGAHIVSARRLRAAWSPSHWRKPPTFIGCGGKPRCLARPCCARERGAVHFKRAW